MGNNTGIMCYQFLMEMEAEHQKIKEMMIAPKFAKLLKESVDEVDQKLHRSKTNELITEFVTKSFDNTLTVLEAVTQNIDRFGYNETLGQLCEAKVKSLTEADREITLSESNMQDTLASLKFDITVDIEVVNEGLAKVLESTINSKEDYNKIVIPFIRLVSECSDKLDKIDISNIEKTDVSIYEVSKVLDKLKKEKLSKEKDKSKIAELKDKLMKEKEKSKKEPAKVKEAVYEASAYLMKAGNIFERLTTVSHENAVKILSEFINYEVSNEATALFESSVNRIMNRFTYSDDEEL